MSSLKVDNITGRGNAGFTGSVKTEGGNTTTDLQQGLCKVWVNVGQASSYVERDTFNLTTHQDISEGKSKLIFTNNFADANHAASAMASNLNNLVGNDNDNFVQTSSAIQVGVYDASNAIQDALYLTVSIHGDLA